MEFVVQNWHIDVTQYNGLHLTLIVVILLCNINWYLSLLKARLGMATCRAG